MKFSVLIAITTLLLQAPSSLAADEDRAADHFENPDEEDVPEIPITPTPTAIPSSGPTAFPTNTPSESPSAKPSPTPSIAPSISPSAPPSSSPSVPPSSIPSSSPSASPTSTPSSSPSESPTSTPSSSPSESPSAMPSLGPSHSPSLALSNAPSAVPSLTPSEAPSSVPSINPTKSDCESNDGIFGALPSEDAIIGFSYEVEVNSIMDTETIQQTILPSLENAIVDSILPALFKDQCDHSSRRLRLQRRLSEVKGISKNPEDLIYDDYACGSVADGNSCVVVSGELTLFAGDKAALSAETDTVKKAIREGMEAGTLSDTQEDIVRVTYVEIDPQANSVQDIPEANDDDNRTLAISPVPFIIGGAVLLVLLVGIAYRQKRKNSNQDSGATQTGGSQMESQMEQQGSQEFNL